MGRKGHQNGQIVHPPHTGAAFVRQMHRFDELGAIGPKPQSTRARAIGAGGDGAHADGEWVSAQSVIACADVLAAAARAFCR